MTAKKIKAKRRKRLISKRKKEVSDLYFSLNGGMEHQELEAIIADSNDAIVVYDLDKKIMSWNKGAALLYGYTRKEALRMHFNALVPKGFLEENEKSFENIAKGIPVKLFETKRITKDGRVLDVWVSISCLVNYQGKTGAFVTTVRDITEQKLIIEKNRYLTQEIIRVQEEERKRIAQGIHDDLGQSLVALKMLLLAHASDVIKESPVLKEKVGEMQKNIDDIIEKARRLSHELIPPSLKYVGISRAIKGLIKMYEGNQDITIRFIHRNIRKIKLDSVDVILYRIVQESLNNSIKHARATRVTITLLYKKGKLMLRIHDNGKGIPLLSGKPGREGIGIAIMRERARLINAEFRIDSSPKKGTAVTVTVPITEKNSS